MNHEQKAALAWLREFGHPTLRPEVRRHAELLLGMIPGTAEGYLVEGAGWSRFRGTFEEATAEARKGLANGETVTLKPGRSATRLADNVDIVIVGAPHAPTPADPFRFAGEVGHTFHVDRAKPLGPQIAEVQHRLGRLIEDGFGVVTVSR